MRRQWQRWLRLLIDLVIVGGLVLLFLRLGAGSARLESTRATKSLLNATWKLRGKIPAPHGAVLFYEQYRVCPSWRDVYLYALYATDEPWETVWSYYHDKATASAWPTCGDYGTSRLECRDAFPRDDPRSYSLTVERYTDSLSRRFPPADVEKARAAGVTVYAIEIWTIEDDGSEERCPSRPTEPNFCGCVGWSYWQRSALGWKPVAPPPSPTEIPNPYPILTEPPLAPSYPTQRSYP